MVFPLPLRRLVLRLALALGADALAYADPIISEFMAANGKTLADVNGKFSDWVEIHNPATAPFNLGDWYLTADAATKTKWQFPAVTVPAGGYLVVFASGENRRDPAKQLHTNFSLGSDGDYLGLIKADGLTVATEFVPKYPAQFDDISYGITQPVAGGEAPRTGYFRSPTPGARNGGADALLLFERVTFSRPSRPFTGSVAVTMSGAAAGQRIRYVVAPPAATGANVPEPTAKSTEYTGPVTISASAIVRAAVFAADGGGQGAATTAHYVRLATTGTARLDTFSSQLPILVIDTHGTGPLIKDGIERPGWLYTWDRPASGLTSLTSAPGAASSLSTNVRGASSADFPKKGYALRLDNGLGKDNPLPLFGLPAFDNWSLIASWKYDRSHIHNRFIYTLSNRLGRWAPRTQAVEVFCNANGGDLDASDYVGLHVLTDALKIDAKRIDIKSIEPSDTGPNSVTGGYLLKIDLADSDEFNFQTKWGFPGPPSAVVVDTPKLPAMPKAQRDYIEGYVQGFEDALFSDYAVGWRQRTHLDYIDRPAWIDQHIINVLSLNIDGLQRSTYLTKDRNGRLAAGPAWDHDRSMGGGDVRAERPDIWSGPDGGVNYWEFAWWAILAHDPDFIQAWIDRWQTLRRNEFSTANLTALVDALAADIGPAAAARDTLQWPDNASRFGGGWQGEINHLKTWLTQRVDWIDAQFTAPPLVTNANGTLTVKAATGAQIAYTTDGSDPRAIDGKLALTARLAAGPLTFPDTLNLQARSYRENVDPNVVPGSAWSAAVGGPNSSVITTPPRLANLSSLGFVAGEGKNLLAGIIVSDTAGKQYLARAIGPALAGFGVPGTLADPVLTILDSAGKEIARNSDWGTGPDASQLAVISAAAGAFPLARNSRDSALIIRLPYGQFSLQLTSASGAAGLGMVELYELDSAVGRTLNLSTKGLVRGGDGLLVGGLTVAGTAPKRLVLRAVGPALVDFGVPDALADPVLTVRTGGKPVATNDDWEKPLGTTATVAEISSAMAAVGAFALPAGGKDAALLLTLPPGSYTAEVAGKVSAEGVVLLEVYELP